MNIYFDIYVLEHLYTLFTINGVTGTTIKKKKMDDLVNIPLMRNILNEHDNYIKNDYSFQFDITNKESQPFTFWFLCYTYLVLSAINPSRVKEIDSEIEWESINDQIYFLMRKLVIEYPNMDISHVNNLTYSNQPTYEDIKNIHMYNKNSQEKMVEIKDKLLKFQIENKPLLPVMLHIIKCIGMNEIPLAQNIYWFDLCRFIQLGMMNNLYNFKFGTVDELLKLFTPGSTMYNGINQYKPLINVWFNYYLLKNQKMKLVDAMIDYVQDYKKIQKQFSTKELNWS